MRTEIIVRFDYGAMYRGSLSRRTGGLIHAGPDRVLFDVTV